MNRALSGKTKINIYQYSHYAQDTRTPDKTAGRLERQFGPVVDVFDKRDRAKLFQWRRPSLSVGLGASVDKIDEDDWLLTC